MTSAEILFKEAGDQRLDPPPEDGRKWTYRDRQNGAGVEYIWLDEFCLSDPARGDSGPYVIEERKKELGKLTDIFRGATRVCVFCHEPNCDHTHSRCIWGKRIWTLGEIVHAADILIMTRVFASSKQRQHPVTIMRPLKAQTFREDMQHEAAKDKRWHLYSIMQHAGNSGTVSWQTAIHSFVVEAILRDEAGSFEDHILLGKALNGLLPRRARIQDLKGKDGWEDLAWLLELNQGFFNTTGLAAVCSIAESNVPRHRWLGKPIEPKEGNERLEPLVTSFPVRIKQKDGKLDPALFFVGPRTIPLHHWLERDSYALFNRDE
ncbi:hypothetical protein M422DRAFT_146380, partial [Sphaerobolus stellatus SS14]